MSRYLIVGNWKMNPATLEDAKRIARKTRKAASMLAHTDVAICSPFVYISACASKRSPKIPYIGAQSVSYEEGGPFTGEVSASMLHDLGVEYVIAGHSEERKRGDTDASISKRVKAVVENGMTAILCVGELVRDEGGVYLETLKEQIKNSLADIPANHAKDIILAYEPVWAVGAKEPMVPEQIYEMSLFVKKSFADVFGPDAGMKVKVLYGGAVNFRNAADILNIGKVNGLLVGRESVNPVGFIELLKAVDNVS